MLNKNYKGKAKTKNGLTYGRSINLEFIKKIDESQEEEDWIKIDENNLTVYTDYRMLEIFCTYEYLEEYNIYKSNQNDKYQEVIKIISLEREQFFSPDCLKKMVGENLFYITITVEDLTTNCTDIIMNEFPIYYFQFQNSVEELTSVFPCSLSYQDCKYTSTISLEKNNQSLSLSSSITKYRQNYII